MFARVKNPRDVVIRGCENGLPLFSEFVEVRKGVDGLVESAGKSGENHDLVLYPIRPSLQLREAGDTLHEICRVHIPILD